MKKLVFNAFFVCIALASQAQVSDGSKIGITTGRGLTGLRSDAFATAATPPSEVKGDFYADSVWQTGGVKFQKAIPQIGGGESDSLAGIQIRYNVLNNELEVLADEKKNDVRVIKGGMLRSFSLDGSPGASFINVATLQPGSLTGFGEVLSSGKTMLIKHFRTRITKPNYNPGFATGEKNTIVRIDHDYYAATGNSLKKLDLGKKLPEAFADQKQQAEKYAKDNALNLKKEEDVVRLFDFINGK
ncbi:hypothetical protein [Dyadobacter sandarakinus]|uniref:Uncharacterized protein n=1 Tax=Dyadobacter sandarakinus TaxID=2747268 RepID=A0ABX7I9I7_9BACT|nr:hypothetical protein [Dyadobacter sandarakinus]QRR02777.1 hypothetical protein HWI92_18585 [Dyadobacter sandarakinus]